jgi:hypothetical protein
VHPSEVHKSRFGCLRILEIDIFPTNPADVVEKSIKSVLKFRFGAPQVLDRHRICEPSLVIGRYSTSSIAGEQSHHNEVHAPAYDTYDQLQRDLIKTLFVLAYRLYNLDCC